MADELGLLDELEEPCRAIIAQQEARTAADSSGGRAPHTPPLHDDGGDAADNDNVLLAARAYATLAAIHTNRGQLHEAEEEASRCVELTRSVLGDDHKDTAASAAGLQAVQAARTVVAAAAERPDLQPRNPKTREEVALLAELARDDAFNPVRIATLLADPALNPNIQDEDGSTPLMLACVGGQPHIVDALLKAGADVNTANKV
ncbi:hypothetical protein GPECTOR_138g655 [Gonium pectorale]|uniref:Uncharacterized protein n=1 Tax=Gonium pectorale TaxID=33097 RepID=A0A150FY24_GONPE|nr:hypothetical protein GPECTOR_138g655 [Gonium pectorale]|eukprot:KXZ42524.1 hypothetical protein GPECTOR_138g655 [Gonium pectorale]